MICWVHVGRRSGGQRRMCCVNVATSIGAKALSRSPNLHEYPVISFLYHLVDFIDVLLSSSDTRSSFTFLALVTSAFAYQVLTPGSSNGWTTAGQHLSCAPSITDTYHNRNNTSLGHYMLKQQQAELDDLNAGSVCLEGISSFEQAPSCLTLMI
jgi:hypothetical protein